MFIATVVATVTGDKTSASIPMKRGLTQGGGLHPPLFKSFINDMPKKLRDMIREKFPEAIIDEPAILVADDVIALSTTRDEMQAIADKCCEWAEANGLKWNSLKSKLLRMIRQLRADQEMAWKQKQR